MEFDVLSPAKVNLFLKVLSKRDDGFHEIVSLMQAVSLYDEITLGIGDGDSIEVSSDDPLVPSDNTNLAYRAARLFLDTVGKDRAISIHIKKHIPVGAGLGGGSSNAATVLMCLRDALLPCLDDGRLIDMASRLGSDVPFFIFGRPAIATGRGDILRAVTLPSYGYVLVNPGFEVSSAWSYTNLDLTKKHEDNILFYSGILSGEPLDIRGFLVNDLEGVAVSRYPVIIRLKQRLLDAGAIGALMSGSGPTVFGVFEDQRSAEKACPALKHGLGMSFRVFTARGL
ncbi:MAG: 4-(cytidine 5'-diphospho)-2-C-methyl-D-erythritol kinase [Deltaproteobacteria bacterium]|nr:4-(cytidine 5'-diphospho)-2-C-methyl-D-erythritol kinase [Deltaproteobacteria bacterium]